MRRQRHRSTPRYYRPALEPLGGSPFDMEGAGPLSLPPTPPRVPRAPAWLLLALIAAALLALAGCHCGPPPRPAPVFVPH